MSPMPDGVRDSAERTLDEAFRATPRADFLRPGELTRSGHDGPLPIGQGQTSSQPRTVRAMLTLLEVSPGQRVLDVGAGSGWTTALLAHLVGPDGQVVGVERIAELAEWGAGNLARTQRPWGEVMLAAPGVLGAPGLAPFDRILVSAMADALPTSLIDQLAPGGRLVVPVAGRMVRVTKGEDGAVSTSEHGAYRFVPLVED